jgi:non-ribosomal peptide synthetase component F
MIIVALLNFFLSGKPKGAVIEHRSFATSSLAHSAAHQMNPNSRVLQFTSYAWDVNIVEHLSTLLVGGCICVPSEAQRREDFAKVVAAYGANWAFLTPSMSRIMDPSKLKTLQTLVIGGDVVTPRELNLWRSHVNLYLIYGPSETSVFCSSTPPVTAEMNDGRNLGHFFGCDAWIVSPEDHNKLLPVGAVGELLVRLVLIYKMIYLCRGMGSLGSVAIADTTLAISFTLETTPIFPGLPVILPKRSANSLNRLKALSLVAAT